VVTDAAPIYPSVLDELLPAAWRHLERYANNRRLRPMRGLQTDRTAQVVIAGHALVQICAAATPNVESTHSPRCGPPRRSPNSQK
jgi:hypothetical protein